MISLRTTISSSISQHWINIFFIFCIAFLINGTFYFLSGVPLKYQQSSDATVHMVDWQRISRDYSGEFENDLMFQNYQVQPTGVLLVDRLLVTIGEMFSIDLLQWSIVISFLSLALFLSGVYALVSYSTKNRLLAFIISLVSIIPVISLGLSSWGFLAKGFVPKEISLGIAVWLSIIYLYGTATGSKRTVGLFFLLLGIFSNWYPVLFFHYALVLFTVEVIRQKTVRREHFMYGAIFLVAAPIALFDIFIRASHFTPSIISIITDHYTATLHSLSYLFIHYLRKQIIYVLFVGILWYIYRRILQKEYPTTIKIWYAIWWSALAWSLVGVGIEIAVPSLMKYLISRTSVWFYAASMIIVGYTAHEIFFNHYVRSLKNRVVFSSLLLLILLMQTSIFHAYNGLKSMRQNTQDYLQYLTVLTQIKSKIPRGAIVLSNPDREAKTVRVYGEVGSYVSWKDGNVTLFDGTAATAWFERYKETRSVFATKDFSAIQDFAVKRDLSFYLFNKNDILSGKDELAESTIMESGSYGLAQFKH